MGINLTPYSIALVDENIYFSTPLFKFIGRDKTEYDDLLCKNENSFEPYGYHLLNCGKKLF